MFGCSEGSLFAVKVHCSTEDPLSELSLIPSENPSSYYELQLCQLIHSQITIMPINSKSNTFKCWSEGSPLACGEGSLLAVKVHSQILLNVGVKAHG
jgi:hypothetical protein